VKNHPASRPANRLAGEKSPYLLQHAHNPVDWLPWGGEAFELARVADKPVFLSIGYSTCHWCHVMARESFENPEIARLLNAHFVSIKVDREERPDVDRVYMAFVQATTGGGGWPMSVFLTPDLNPFAGGTYFPPEDRHGRAGFATVLARIAAAWENDRARVLAQGEQMVEALREYTASPAETGSAPGVEILQNACGQIARTFDPELGGFGAAPKFPRPVILNFLLRFQASGAPGSAQALDMALFTLRKMAAGGLHDHLGGGFHRYSVDRFWHIPHFEKMLYDQAQLASAYLDAFQITRDPVHEKTARDVLDYVLRDLTGPQGGFYSAEDADSAVTADMDSSQAHAGKAEGAFYVWTKQEIDTLLGAEEAKIFTRFYSVEPGGNAPDGSDPQGEFAGKNTLIQRMTISAAANFFKKDESEINRSLAASCRILFEARERRPRPHRDDKIITAWNGLMISAFARAAQVLDDPGYLAAATRAAAFVRTHLTRGGALVRSHRMGASDVEGFTDDYAFLIQGLLDLYEASLDIAWLQWAADLQVKQDAVFADNEHGGYFSVRADDPHILLRLKEDYDGAEPSPNSVSALNLLRLAQMTGNDSHRSRAEKTVAAFSAQLTKMPHAMPQMLVALDFLLAKPLQIVLSGKPGAPDTRALLREAHRFFIPHKVLLLADGGEGQRWLGERLEFIKTAVPLDEQAAAYVCENFACRRPVSDPASLQLLLAGRNPIPEPVN
jgi:uncharacterized protein YyaL (SSP411 family)